MNPKTHLKRTGLRHYLLVSLALASLEVRHAWFEHASLKCKANVKKGDYEHSLTQSLTHSLTQSLIHSLTHSLNHFSSFTCCCARTSPLNHPINQPLARSYR